jgi:hypothetical protein
VAGVSPSDIGTTATGDTPHSPNGHADMSVDAQRLAAAGYAVFRLDLDKRPLAGGNGFHDATSDAATVRDWWRERPASLIGIALPAGTLAVDLDT